MLEATKGFVVLLTGLGALEVLDHGAQQVAEEIVRHLHLNPASRYPRIFQQLADEATPENLWTLALAAAAYSLVRFIEANGLWRQRRWAEWFSLVSGAIYIPFELWELFQVVTWMRLAFLAINAGVVGYLIWVMKARDPRASGRA